jgi:diguanylate cyclase (GGDEF)-like protein/PAS domain S-box-containing protein
MSAINESVDSLGLRLSKVENFDNLSPKDRVDLALSTSQEGVWDWDLETNEVFFSPSLYRMLGLDPVASPIDPPQWTHLVHPEDRFRTLRAVRAHLIGRTERYKIDHRIRHGSGMYRWIAARGSALRDTDGRPLRLIGMSTDDTDQKKMELALQERQSLLRGAVESSLDAFLIMRAVRDYDGRIEDFEIIECNAPACDLLNIENLECVGTSLNELKPIAPIADRLSFYISATEERSSQVQEFSYVSEEGQQKWAYEQIVPVQNGIALTISDITDRRNAEQALRESEAKIQRITESVPELIYIFDVAQRQVTYRNRSLLSILGYAGADQPMLDYETLARVVFAEDVPILENHFHKVCQVVDDGVHEVQVRMVRADGQLQWRSIRTLVFARDERGLPSQLIGSSMDITEQKFAESTMQRNMVELEEAHRLLEERQSELERLNRLLEELVTQDGLTGLVNHRTLYDRLDKEYSRAIRHGEPLSLIMTDLDDFKAYNDRFGHPAGDSRLCEFARILRQEVRSEDIAARYGGEEFAIMLPNTSLAEALVMAERIRGRLDQDRGEHRFTASFGCAQLKADALDPSQLVKDADAALDQAKRDGKNCIRTANFLGTDLKA